MKEMREIWKIALPIVIQGIVFRLQALTDEAFLGKLDGKYISALGAGSFPYATTTETVVALSIGLAILVAQLYGNGNRNKIWEYTRSYACFGSWLPFSLFMLWFCFAKEVLMLFRVDEVILQYSVSYVRICSISLLIFGVDCALQAMLQGMGDTKPILMSSMIKVLLNIAVSYVLIFGKIGFPALALVGAAIGTVTANYVSAFVLIVYVMLCNKKERRVERLHGIELREYMECVRIGVPTAMEFFLWNTSNMILMAFLNNINYQATAIYTLTYSVEIVVYAIFNGTGKAVMTLIGNSIGRSEWKKANQYMKQGLLSNSLWGGVSLIFFFFFHEKVIAIFTTDLYLVKHAGKYLVITAIILFPKSLNVLVGNGIRAYKDTSWMLYSQMLGSAFVVVCSYTLLHIFSYGVTAIYVTLFLDEMLRGAINSFYYIKNYGKRSGLRCGRMNH